MTEIQSSRESLMEKSTFDMSVKANIMYEKCAFDLIHRNSVIKINGVVN